jgi:hypothetical protein
MGDYTNPCSSITWTDFDLAIQVGPHLTVSLQCCYLHWQMTAGTVRIP